MMMHTLHKSTLRFTQGDLQLKYARERKVEK